MAGHRVTGLQQAGCAVLASSLAACVVVADGDRDRGGSEAPPAVHSEADMVAYCRGEAAEEFAVRPQEITTLPVEASDAGFVVYGEVGQGAGVQTFECRFDGDRELVSIGRG